MRSFFPAPALLPVSPNNLVYYVYTGWYRWCVSVPLCLTMSSNVSVMKFKIKSLQREQKYQQGTPIFFKWGAVAPGPVPKVVR